MEYKLKLRDSLAKNFDDMGYQEVSVLENNNLLAVKCYSDDSGYYCFIDKNNDLYKFLQYSNESEVTRVFEKPEDFIKHLLDNNILRLNMDILFGISLGEVI